MEILLPMKMNLHISTWPHMHHEDWILEILDCIKKAVLIATRRNTTQQVFK